MVNFSPLGWMAVWPIFKGQADRTFVLGAGEWDPIFWGVESNLGANFAANKRDRNFPTKNIAHEKSGLRYGVLDRFLLF